MKKILILMCMISSLSFAATPNAGTINRDTEYNLKEQAKPKLQPPEQIKKEVDELDLPDAQKVLVNSFTIDGNTLFNDEELQELIKEYTNKELTFKRLKEVIKILATHYREADYLAKVYFPEQDVTKGVVAINIIEGKLGNIKINSNSRLNPEFSKKYISTHQQQNQPIHMNELDRSILLLSDIPGVSAESSLSGGSQRELTDITVTTKDTPFFNGSLSTSNTGSRSTGKNQATFNSALNNLSSYGDQLKFTAVKSEGNQYIYGAYNFPIFNDGLRGELFVSNSDYKLIDSFSTSESEGGADNYGFQLNYPLVRTATKNINLYTKYENKLLRDYALGSNTANKKVQYLNLGISSSFQDKLFGGGTNQISLGYTYGTLDRKSNASDYTTDQATAKTNGAYDKLYLTLNRAQQLPNDFILRFNSSFQYATQNLDSSEKMGLGGPYNVRAYPSSEASGDQALLVQIELSKNILQNLELFGFYDYGWVRTNNDLWNNWNSGSDIKNIYSLDGIGIGIKYKPVDRLSIDGTFARALKSNKGVANDSINSDGSKRSNRTWATLTYQF